MVMHQKESLDSLVRKICEKHPDFFSSRQHAGDFSDKLGYIYKGRKDAIKTHNVGMKMIWRYEGDAEEDAEGFFDYSEKIKGMTEDCFTEYH